jgi:hypothetical protein
VPIDPKIAEAFRAAVTVHLSGEDPNDYLGVFAEIGVTDMIQLAGLGIAMTANLCRLLGLDDALTFAGQPPDEIWRVLCQSGRELGLPGMV